LYSNTLDFSIAQHEEKQKKKQEANKIDPGALPAYLLDRRNTSTAKVLSNMIKQKRKEKAGKWNVPIPKVRPLSEDEVFRVLRTGKRKSTYLVVANATSVVFFVSD